MSDDGTFRGGHKQDGWRVGEWDIYRPLAWVYDGSSDYSIGWADDPQANCVAALWDRDPKRAHAYCDLFAAAPDLLKALKVAQELLERNGIERPEIAAAIAKAEGRDG